MPYGRRVVVDRRPRGSGAGQPVRWSHEGVDARRLREPGPAVAGVARRAAPTSVRDIAERTGLPQPYLEQILLALKGAGLVRSKRGVGGGYVLARPAGDHPRADRERRRRSHRGRRFGEPHPNGACDHEGQCVLLAIWADVGVQMRNILEAQTLADIARISRGERGRGPAGRPPPY